MSVSATTINATSIEQIDIGTALNGTDDTQLASGNFIKNTLYLLNYSIDYVISGVKTFTNGFPLTSSTVTTTPISLGMTRASIIDIKPANANTNSVLIQNQTQFMSPNIGLVSATPFRNPIVVKSGQPNRILNGTVIATSAGATVAFTTAFATVPLVFLTPNVNTTPGSGAFDVSTTGFKAHAGSNTTCLWFALGT